MPDSQDITPAISAILQPVENNRLTRPPGPGWPPGFCPNPGGRPKRAIISDALRDELLEAVESGDHTQATAIAKSMVRKAIAGKVDAATFVRDTTEGRPVQGIRVEHGIDEQTARRLAD